MGYAGMRRGIAARAGCAAAWIVLALVVAGCRTTPPPVGADARKAPLDFRLLAHFADVYRSVRYTKDPEAVRRAWEGFYQEVAVVDLSATESRYLVGTVPGGGRQEIVVRGTANLRNAILDAEVAKGWNKELGIRLHSGFERMALALYKDLRPRIRPDADLVLFGHSLGAAEAVILGMLLQHDGFRVTAVYASGQPKVTDQQGVELWTNLPVLRLSCEGDPVPFLPPRIASTREPYAHLGQEVLLLDGPYYVLVNDRIAEEARLAEVWQMLKDENPRAAIHLHLFYPNYYEKIRAKAEGAVEETPDQRYRRLVLPDTGN